MAALCEPSKQLRAHVHFVPKVREVRLLTFMAPRQYSYISNGILKHLYHSFGTGHTAKARGLLHKVCAANGVRTCAARKLFNIFHLKCQYLRSINIAKTSPSPEPRVAPFTFFTHKQSVPMSLGPRTQT